MTSTEFCYWLQGLMEVGNPTTLNEEQIKIIKAHLQLVFKQDPKIKALMDSLQPGTGTVTIPYPHIPTTTTIPWTVPEATNPWVIDGMPDNYCARIMPSEDDIQIC